jgi:hypothetical protein
MIRKLDLEKVQGDPAGVIHNVADMDKRILALADEWDAAKKENEKNWWEIWKFWKWGAKIDLGQVTKFLLDSLDEFINMVDDKLFEGADKKATVLKYIDTLYEYVIREAVPIWLKPFAGTIKNYIIYKVISTSIDWIVSKYRNGAWRDKLETEE